MNGKYKDMLLMPHPESSVHPRMPLKDRAAQFSPFAALTGYEDALRETARLTDRFIELEEDQKQEIDRQIFYLQKHIAEQFPVKITYFEPDSRKNGGTYRTLEGCVQKISDLNRTIRLKETEIPIERIYEINFVTENGYELPFL